MKHLKVIFDLELCDFCILQVLERSIDMTIRIFTMQSGKVVCSESTTENEKKINLDILKSMMSIKWINLIEITAL